MEQKHSFYEILEVGLFSEPDKIKASYRRLARKYHPDMNPDNPNAESLFKKIGEAYAVLSDPQKRLLYDQSIGIGQKRQGDGRKPQPQQAPKAKTSDGERTGQSKTPPKPSSVGKQQSQPNINVDGTPFKDMFDSLFRGGEKAAEAPPPNKAPNRNPYPEKMASAKSVRGEDITVEAFISRHEAESGIVKTASVHHSEPCKRCSSTGRVNGVICPVCNGEKQLVTVHKIDVRIPPGVKSGSKVRVAKEGGRGLNGGESGDLFLLIRIEEDQNLKIDGVNVICEIPITITEAVLGAEIDVNTLHGKVKMVIPPQTNSGRVFRLKGQGVSLSGATGDQFVTVQIVAPSTLSTRERELYEELSKLSKDSPRKHL